MACQSGEYSERLETERLELNGLEPEEGRQKRCGTQREARVPQRERYQKQGRNATTRPTQKRPPFWLFPLLWLGLLCLGGMASGMMPGMARGLVSAAHAQSVPTGEVAPLFVQPLSNTDVRLLTHTVDVTVRVDGEGVLYQVRAAYRIHNQGRETITLPLEIFVAALGTGAGTMTPSGLVNAPTLQVDNQPIAVQAGGEGRWNGQVNLAADARRVLLLTYQQRPQAAPFLRYQYPFTQLRGWGNNPESWRVNLDLPGEASGLIPAASWVRTAPDGWQYTGDVLSWLGTRLMPTEAITLQFMEPATWQRGESLRRSLASQPSVALYRQMGDHDAALYRSPQLAQSSRERFYAQALAAYAEGIRLAQGGGVSAQEQVGLHRELARLYRSRSVIGDQVDYIYVGLMLQEVRRGIELTGGVLNPGDELTQWLAEGLRMQLQSARIRQNWPEAIQVLEDLSSMPQPLVDQAWVEAEISQIRLTQSVELLALGEEGAAIALAGTAIRESDLAPPPEQRAIFARWEVSVRLTPQGHVLDAVAHPIPGREESAARSGEQLRLVWQPHLNRNAQVDQSSAGTLHVRLTDLALSERLALAQSLPSAQEWALLRTLLFTIEPQQAQESRLIWQQIRLSQAVDLRTVADQWRGTIALLERAAAEMTALSSTDPAAQINQNLRQIYLRQEADHWRRLVDESSVQVTLAPADRGGASTLPGQTWLLKPVDPAQTLTAQAEVISPLRLLLAILLIILSVLLISLILWWLL